MSSSAVAIEPAEPALSPAIPRKRKLRLSPAEKDRRSKHIGQFAAKGGAAAMANKSPEERAAFGAMGGKALLERYRVMKSASGSDTPEGYRLRRIELEGKRDWLLDKLIECAETETKLDALSELRAALTEIRAEIPILLEREERAKAAGPSVPTAPRAPIGQPAPVATSAPSAPASPGNPPPENPATDISPPISPD
ncbi:MAG: hypothetical protein EBS21_10765 [Sphingomonadaceae bacterium]|nr:hypothetical protein [Sphingomonadaceae bacterium]